MNDTHTQRKAFLGLAYGMLAHLLWDVFPVYFKQLGPVPALQAVAHRIVRSAVFLCILYSGAFTVLCGCRSKPETYHHWLYSVPIPHTAFSSGSLHLS